MRGDAMTKSEVCVRTRERETDRHRQRQRFEGTVLWL